MLFSFIVPVKNGLAYTRALVESVSTTNPGVDVEWVIVDSGSTDGTLEWASAVGARVVKFRSDPFNYCAAVNAGTEAATGDLWIVANNDIEFRSVGDLVRLERLFAEWPLIGVMSPGRAAGDSELEFRYGGVNGACWVVRPEALRGWGGMPEALSGYGWDEAYTHLQCWRRRLAFAWLTGWEVFHHGSVTFGPEAGNVSPALRRNLTRLLKVVEAPDLDTTESPERIVNRLYEREQQSAPARLIWNQGSAEWFNRQGYVNAKLQTSEDPKVPMVVGTNATANEYQWLPWLANELILQPLAMAVGADGWWAMRDPAKDTARPEGELRQALAGARAVGPAPPRLMPPLAHKRASLKERLSAATHAWRARGRSLPEGW